ncbi:hypothetical protein ABIB00_007334 [Bradyrhizobium sp. LB14.3]
MHVLSPCIEAGGHCTPASASAGLDTYQASQFFPAETSREIESGFPSRSALRFHAVLCDIADRMPREIPGQLRHDPPHDAGMKLRAKCSQRPRRRDDDRRDRSFAADYALRGRRHVAHERPLFKGTATFPAVAEHNDKMRLEHNDKMRLFGSLHALVADSLLLWRSPRKMLDPNQGPSTHSATGY